MSPSLYTSKTHPGEITAGLALEEAPGRAPGTSFHLKWCSENSRLLCQGFVDTAARWRGNNNPPHSPVRATSVRTVIHTRGNCIGFGAESNYKGIQSSANIHEALAIPETHNSSHLVLEQRANHLPSKNRYLAKRVYAPV